MVYQYGIYQLDFLRQELGDVVLADIPPGIGWMSYRLYDGEEKTDYIMIRTGVRNDQPKGISWYYRRRDREVKIYTTIWEADKIPFAEVFESVSEELKCKMIPHLELLAHG